MYKIEIDWNFKSPFMQILTGTVRIDNISIGTINSQIIPGFRVKKEQGITDYTNCPAIFDRCKPLVDVMVRSYFDGMNLSDCSVEWFRNCSKKNEEIYLTMLD